MIIHQPEIFTQDDHTVVWAKIELKKYCDLVPDFLWYRVPTMYADVVSVQSDAFLVPGLLAGMHFGENIEVRGAVSPRIAFHLDEYQFLLNFRMPKYVSPVEVKILRNQTFESRSTWGRVFVFWRSGFTLHAMETLAPKPIHSGLSNHTLSVYQRIRYSPKR